MNKYILLIFAVLSLNFSFISCSDDDEFVESTEPQSVYVKDVEGNTILVHTTETFQLSMGCLPDNAVVETPIDYYYASSDESIFTVSPAGLITGVGVGDAILTVSTNYENLYTKVMISITDRVYLVTDIQLSETYENNVMPLAATLDLKPFIAVLPENASNPAVAFSSSNTEVISVSKEGVITALTAGQATITIAATDASGVSKSLNLTVKEAQYVNMLDRTGWTVVHTSHNLPEDSGFKNEPTSLFDDSTTTGLSMVKPGKNYGGVKVEAGEEVYFVFDTNAMVEFDFITIVHRSNNSTQGLRPNEFSVYGSDDGENFTIIRENAPGDPAVASYNVDFRTKVKYRYVKILYTGWNVDSGSTIQVAEIKLGTKTY